MLHAWSSYFLRCDGLDGSRYFPATRQSVGVLMILKPIDLEQVDIAARENIRAIQSAYKHLRIKGYSKSQARNFIFDALTRIFVKRLRSLNLLIPAILSQSKKDSVQ